jgi:uncharacterized membrane protein
MELVGMIIGGIGGLVALIGGIWFLVVAFRQSVWWGLGSIFIPFVSLIFLIIHWADAKKPFFVWLLGAVIAVIVAILLPGAIPTG